MEKEIKSVGDYLKNYRNKNNLSISALSRMTDISRPYLSQIEDGKVPSKKTIRKLAKGMSKKTPTPSPTGDGFVIDYTEVEMLDLAGYKAWPEPGEESWEEYESQEKINKLERQIFRLEGQISRLEEEVNSYKTSIDIGNLYGKYNKIYLDRKELSKGEKYALNNFLMGLLELREDN
ncbi:helix-turn-helix transcriptional regulator [Psychrobacillus sp. Sa2BUA9]|uniref:Helix-turn-helix transcriptional regulator n=1 Tax=Psychrobacillus faecigallinarum TaxID=2762235 RepID=A0ABR8RBU8_9BACI|nr:helix-turn-helix transcriptional regulator [Psychrobacillus faecigallinarum]MBD7945272.1 helix-turn-helix transcriptional regulator [Psychrobacillus faecigallinarum]